MIYEPAATVCHVGSVVADQHGELAVAVKYYFSKHFAHRPLRRAFGAVHQCLAYLRL